MSKAAKPTRWVAWIRLDWKRWVAAVYCDTDSEQVADDACRKWLAEDPKEMALAYRTNMDSEYLLLPAGEYPYVRPR